MTYTTFQPDHLLTHTHRGTYRMLDQANNKKISEMTDAELQQRKLPTEIFKIHQPDIIQTLNDIKIDSIKNKISLTKTKTITKEMTLSKFYPDELLNDAKAKVHMKKKINIQEGEDDEEETSQGSDAESDISNTEQSDEEDNDYAEDYQESEIDDSE